MMEEKKNSKFFILKIQKNPEPLNEYQKERIEKDWYKLICIGFSVMAYTSIFVIDNEIFDEFNLINLIKFICSLIIWEISTVLIMKIPGYIRSKLK